MIYCPRCGSLLAKSDRHFDGYTLNRCRDCDMFNLDGSPVWVPRGPDLLSRLLGGAEQVEESRGRDDDALHSSDHDPRWTKAPDGLPVAPPPVVTFPWPGR